MARMILAAAAILTLCALPAQALEFTLFFGQSSGGELGGFGYQVRNAGDLNGDGYPDIVVGAPYDSTEGVDAGRAFVWFGGPEMTGEPDLILDETNGGDYFGFSVAGVGDVDNDGFDDLAVGAPGYDQSGQNRGRVILYRGGTNMDASFDREILGEVGGDRFGWSISAAGDMDRDNYDDMVVGAPYNDSGGLDVGRVYFFAGQSSINSIGPDATDADVIWTGQAGGGPSNTTNFAAFAPDGQAIGGPGFGFSLASVHDFRDDDRAAVAIGAPGQNGAQGWVFLFAAASSSSQMPSTTPQAIFKNPTANEEFGWSVANGGYVNSGGTDLLVGAPGTSGSRGLVHVYYGSSSVSGDVTSSDLSRYQGVAGDRFGYSVSGAGDVDGGGGNWLVGAPNRSTSGLDAGQVYLYSKTSSSPVQVGPQGGGTAPVAEDMWGFSLDGFFGDLDGDGLDDFLVGAPNGNGPENAERGVVAIVSSGARIVATPSMRLEGARRSSGFVELSFAASHVSAFDDAILASGGRQIARLGAGIWPDARGLTARVSLAELEADTVELSWVTAGIQTTASFELPDFRAAAPSLIAANPNPFNPRTTISVEMPQAGHVRLRIVDLRGRIVRDLFSGQLSAGVTPILFDGTDDSGRRLGSGSYLALLETGEGRDTSRLTLVQ